MPPLKAELADPPSQICDLPALWSVFDHTMLARITREAGRVFHSLIHHGWG